MDSTTLNGGYREFKLDNGLLVALQDRSGEVIEGRLAVYHGALNEKPGEEGIAHFLEHALVTGGSQKYGLSKTDSTRAELPALNAHTSLTAIRFPISTLREDIALYLDFVSDIAFHPRLDVTRVDSERQRILREIHDEKIDPAFEDSRAAHVALLSGSPQTYYIKGREEVLENVVPDNLRNFHQRGFFVNNSDLILVGSLPANIEELIEECFGNKQVGKRTRVTIPTPPALMEKVVLHVNAPDRYNKEKPLESSATLDIGMLAPDYHSPKSFAVCIAAAITGSRLFQRLSIERGLAYSTKGYYNGICNVGVVTLGGTFLAQAHEEVIDTIFSEIQRMQREPVTEDELRREKKCVKYGFAKILEQADGHVRAIESKWEYGRTTKEWLAGYESVTAKEIMEVANSHFPQSRNEGEYVLLLRDPLKQT